MTLLFRKMSQIRILNQCQCGSAGSSYSTHALVHSLTCAESFRGL